MQIASRAICAQPQPLRLHPADGGADGGTDAGDAAGADARLGRRAFFRIALHRQREGDRGGAYGGVIEECGHWVFEEKTDFICGELERFWAGHD